MSKVMLQCRKGFGQPLDDGVQEGDTIIFHPNRGRGVMGFFDTVLHEVLHKLEVDWSESKIRKETLQLKKQFTNRQRQQVLARVFARLKWIK